MRDEFPASVFALKVEQAEDHDDRTRRRAQANASRTAGAAAGRQGERAGAEQPNRTV